jgi:glycosyltransferase involved in cell wall biosynthesis
LILTIVTVAFNDGPRLRRTMESLGTLGGDIEYLCVIPSSDEETSELFLDQSNNLKIQTRLVNDPGEGIYEAMNFGLRNAEGKFITYWNAGDTLHSSSNLLNMMKVMDFEGFDWGVSLPKTDWRTEIVSNGEEIRNFILQKSSKYLSHQSVVEKREILTRFGGFDLQYRVAADTNHIYQLVELSQPYIFQDFVVSVEKPNFAAKSQRRSRKETISVCANNLHGLERIATVLRLLWRELKFLQRKFFKTI